MTTPADRLREIASADTTRPNMKVALFEYADRIELLGIDNMEHALLFAVGIIAGMEQQLEELRGRGST